MATLMVRNLPDEVAQSLKNRARRRGISVEQQVRELLCEAVFTEQNVHELIQQSWAHQKRPVTLEEIQAGIREARK